MLRRQSRDTNRNIKRLVYCQYGRVKSNVSSVKGPTLETKGQLTKNQHSKRRTNTRNEEPTLETKDQHSKRRVNARNEGSTLETKGQLTKDQHSKRRVNARNERPTHDQPFYISMCTCNDLSELFQGSKYPKNLLTCQWCLTSLQFTSSCER